LSDPMEMGIPYLGIISFSKARTTSWALSVRMGNASTHPENAHVHQKVSVASGSRHFSEVCLQVFKRGPTHISDSCLGLFLHMFHIAYKYCWLGWWGGGHRNVGSAAIQGQLLQMRVPMSILYKGGG
jgi:hypothetical protein